ncbi:MAG: phage protein [Microgenomates group bacterium Gr01-1014_7]|nr:MAG: phage protein [Microgenomates group bacterium Gr01-1014_7]
MVSLEQEGRGAFKMRVTNYQKEIRELGGSRPIAYDPALSAVTGSVKTGLFLSQLLFWAGLGRDKEWTFKTIAEIKQEIGLSRDEQDVCISKLKAKGIISTARKGIPGKRHFRVNFLVLSELIKVYTSHCGKPTNNIVANPQCITENTSEKKEIYIKRKNIKKQFKKQEKTNTYIHTPTSVPLRNPTLPTRTKGEAIISSKPIVPNSTGTLEAGLTPLPADALWEIAGKLNVRYEDVTETYNNLLADLEGENRYKTKNINLTLHKWLKINLAKAYIRPMEELQRLAWTISKPSLVAKDRAQTRRMVEMGLL